MTSPSDLDPNSVKISTQTLGETIHQFVDLPGLPSIQERIIHTQDDQVKKALSDLGWICPQEAKAMRGDLAAKDAEIAKLKRGPTPDYTGEGSAWVPPKAEAPAVVVPDLTNDCPRVEQTVAHIPGVSRGNCFAAVLSGLLKVPIESVPDFDGEDWQKQVNGWLRQFGLAWLQVGGIDEWLPQVGIEGCWHEMSGPTDRFNGSVRHAVAALDGKPKWDPHPSQSGLVEADGGSIFVALRPWELASRAISARMPVEVPSVVVPEPTSDEWRMIAENARSADIVDFLAGAAAYGLWLRGKIPNSIPADRVLGEGMVQVEQKTLERFKRIEVCARDFQERQRNLSASRDSYGFFQADNALEAAIRANQGGSAT